MEECGIKWFGYYFVFDPYYAIAMHPDRCSASFRLHRISIKNSTVTDKSKVIFIRSAKNHIQVSGGGWGHSKAAIPLALLDWAWDANVFISHGVHSPEDLSVFISHYFPLLFPVCCTSHTRNNISNKLLILARLCGLFGNKESQFGGWWDSSYKQCLSELPLVFLWRSNPLASI